MAILTLAATACPGADAPDQQGAWYEGFEGPTVSWRLLGGNAQARVEVHQRARGQAHSGDGCERIRILGTGGGEVLFGHEVGHPRVIDDLLPTVWVKSDRPGIQLGAQIVLPRTRHPQTGRPLTALVYGSSYTKVGQWQQLRLDEVPRLLTRETRVLRTEFGPGVDPREAYLERIVLNVYGGPGVSEVWIDDLDIAGYATIPAGPGAPEGAARPGAAPASNPWVSVAPAQPAGRQTPAAPSAAEPPGRARVRLTGSVLLIDDRPVLPRIIQHQGEPLDRLRQLGFNAVWISQRPTPVMLEEAKRLGLWLLAPPPHDPQSPSPDAPQPWIAAELDGVLAWDLGQALGEAELATARRWAEQIRSSDRRQPGRPVVCRPACNLRAYSRAADILLLGRAVLGTSLELGDYALWLREQPQLARPGTPIWAAVQTQPAESLRQQWVALGQGALPATFSSDQIQLLAYAAVSGGARGLLFESLAPLTGADPDTRLRALTLEMLNLQLGMAEPWLAAGSVAATIPAADKADKGITATVFQAEHGRLVVPTWSGPGAQRVAGQSANLGTTLVIPGVPESYNAYLLGPGGLRPLRHKRQTGGVRIALEQFDLTAMLLLTENPLVVTNMTRRVALASRRWAELTRELAAARLQAAGQTLRALPSRARSGAEGGWLASAQEALGQCDALLAARDDPAAYAQAVRALRAVRLLERTEWDAAVAAWRSPEASPGAVMFSSLPSHAALAGRIAQSRPAASLLSCGDFEDFAAMTEAGWRHFQHAAPGLQCWAELSPSAAHGGRFGLRLGARLAESTGTPALVESPPIWITSPPVSVEAGQLVAIHGWVHVPEPITASVDGLLIVDTLAGEPLAQRVRATKGWQEFTLYRAAAERGTMTVTFALTGLGEAWLDDVTIQPLLP